MDCRVLVYLARRLFYGALVVFATTVFAYGGIRALRPDIPRYAGTTWLQSTWQDVSNALLHLDFGVTCMYNGCPRLHDLWTRGLFIDVSLLFGALVFGAFGGVFLGRWCAAHQGTLGARGIEAGAMLLYCAPPYVLGFLVLLAFDPFFGVLPLSFLIDPSRFGKPFPDFSHYVRGMLFPWLVCAGPVAAAVLRLTLGLTREAVHEDYVRTAFAKGLRREVAIRRHATPASRVAVASYIGAAIPTIVLNVVLVEFVFTLPGFFRHTWRAFGKAAGYVPDLGAPPVDYPTLQAVCVWASALIVMVGIVSDVAVTALDPRLRAAGRA
jgi:peptide/nickel transport system permease protein